MNESSVFLPAAIENDIFRLLNGFPTGVLL